jgi:hypothetical protein
MLEYTDSAVTRNASEKKINSLLDFISSSSDLDLLQVRDSGAERCCVRRALCQFV